MNLGFFFARLKRGLGGLVCPSPSNQCHPPRPPTSHPPPPHFLTPILVNSVRHRKRRGGRVPLQCQLKSFSACFCFTARCAFVRVDGQTDRRTDGRPSGFLSPPPHTLVIMNSSLMPLCWQGVAPWPSPLNTLSLINIPQISDTN